MTPLSARGRGLKFDRCADAGRHYEAALCTRAWIEIGAPRCNNDDETPLSARGRGLKLMHRTRGGGIVCRSLHEGVD